MFNLIIPNLDVKMRPRPAANPNQQEKQKKKILYLCDVSIRGKHNKNDAKITDLFPHFSVEGRGWLYTGYCQRQLKTLFC